MAAFGVVVEGAGCYLRVAERRWLLLHRSEVHRCGFFSTRWIEAASPEEAGEKALALVDEELKTLVVNRPDQPWTVRVSKVWEAIPGEPTERTLGPGFTWFAESPAAADITERDRQDR